MYLSVRVILPYSQLAPIHWEANLSEPFVIGDIYTSILRRSLLQKPLHLHSPEKATLNVASPLKVEYTPTWYWGYTQCPLGDISKVLPCTLAICKYCLHIVVR